MAPKNPAQHKFGFFDACWTVLCPEPQKPVAASSGFKGSLLAPAPSDQTHNPRKVGGFARVGP